jgi:hypothetical protein
MADDRCVHGMIAFGCAWCAGGGVARHISSPELQSPSPSKDAAWTSLSAEQLKCPVCGTETKTDGAPFTSTESIIHHIAGCVRSGSDLNRYQHRTWLERKSGGPIPAGLTQTELAWRVSLAFWERCYPDDEGPD